MYSTNNILITDEDDWIQEHPRQPEPDESSKFQPRKLQPTFPTAVAAPMNAFNDHFQEETPNQPPPSYLYPLSRDDVDSYPFAKDAKRHVSRSTSREKSSPHLLLHRSVSQDEADIKPIIIRPRNYDSRFKHILDESKFNEDVDDLDKSPSPAHKPIQPKQKVERKSRASDEIVKPNYGRYGNEDNLGRGTSPQKQRYRYGEEEEQRKIVTRSTDKFNASVERSSSERERDLFRENLTDREKYRESQKYNHVRKDQFDVPDHGFGSRQSYAEPSLNERRHSPARKSKYPAEKGIHMLDNSGKQAHHPYVEPQIDRSGFRHRSGYDNGNEHHDNKLSRSFAEKPMKAEYEQPMPRNPYKEPDSLPYRESIESMIKSPAMRYKSFEANLMPDGGKMLNGHNAQPNYPAPEKVRDPSIRYHNLEADKYLAEPKSKYAPEPSSRRRAIEKQRSTHNGSPDTVCRVSPKDRFNNAREKFEAMERERSYAQAESRQQQPALRQMEPPQSHHQRHMSPPRRDRSQNQPRYPSQEPKVDWSSEDEQLTPPRRTASGYRDIPAHGPEAYVDHSRAMGPAKSLNNLARGYRHSYAEPVRAQLPRNSGRVGLAAVNPY